MIRLVMQDVIRRSFAASIAAKETFAAEHGETLEKVARLMADVGYRDRGWLAFASTGVGFGAHYGRTLQGDASVSSFEQLFVAPARPLAVVSQLELMWSSAVVLGVPLQGRTLSAFGGVSVDVPVAYTAGSFSQVTTRAALSDLRPGTQIGVMLGFSGVLSR